MALSGIAASAPSDMFASMNASTYPKKVKAQDSTGSGTATSGISTDAGSIGTTFLNLLVQELQNQDPTAPMDSTAMVGQMISLNQLNQLVSINQDLSSLSGTASSGTGTGTYTGYDSTVGSATPAAQASSAMTTAAANAGNPATPLDLSTLSNIFGGK